MTDPLPPYSDSTSTCPKCRGEDIGIEYHPFRPHVAGGGVFIATRCVNPGVTLDECLLRQCRACGWAWLEACADAGSDASPLLSPWGRDAATPGGTYTVTAEDGRTSNPIPYNAPPGFNPGWAPHGTAAG